MSIHQVADKAGVSIATVSRFINQKGYVADDTARVIKEAMDAVGYTPTAVRRGRKVKPDDGIRHGVIAFLSIHPSASPEKMYQMPAFPSLLSGIQGEINRRGLDMVLAHSPGGETIPPMLARNKADGVLLFGFEPLPARLTGILTKIPTVWCFRSPADSSRQFDHVFYDNDQVGKLAAEYMLKRGHRNMAFINKWPAESPHRERREQFVRTAHRHGANVEVIEPEPETDVRSVKPPLVIRNLTDRFAGLQPLPTAAFCPADDMLLNFFHELRNKGIEPERDIELIGCNNAPIIQQMHPRPATIDIKLGMVGRHAVKQLIWRMSSPNEDNCSETLISPSLIPGENENRQVEKRMEMTPAEV